jgi:hypothetical protein
MRDQIEKSLDLSERKEMSLFFLYHFVILILEPELFPWFPIKLLSVPRVSPPPSPPI